MATIDQPTEVLIGQLAVVRWCKLAAAVLTVYDHAITFSQEVELIWGRKRSIPSVLYIFTRYLGDLQLIFTATVSIGSGVSSKLCYVFIRFQGWSSTAIYCFMQGILLIRLLAMHDNPKRLKIGLSLAFLVEIIVLFVMIILGTYSLKVTTYPIPGAVECVPMEVPMWFPAWWVPIILFDFLLFVFAVRIGLRHVRETRCLRERDGGLGELDEKVEGECVERGDQRRLVRWGKQRSRSSDEKGVRAPVKNIVVKVGRASMVEIMLRDSILYYLVLLSINVLNALVWLGMNFFLYEIPQVFSISAVCIMGCRMILNLRHAFYHPGAGEASIKGASLEMRGVDVDVEGMLRGMEDIEEVDRLDLSSGSE